MALPLGTPGVGVPGIDPNADQLAQIDAVEAAAAWAGVTGPLRTGLEAQSDASAEGCSIPSTWITGEVPKRMAGLDRLRKQAKQGF